MPFPARAPAIAAVEAPALSLPPLQQALHHELFVRPAALAQRAAYADFWRAHASSSSSSSGADKEAKRRFGRDIVDEQFLDEAIAQRKRTLEVKRAEKKARDAVVASAADLSVLSLSLSASDASTLTDPLEPSLQEGEGEAALSPHASLRTLARARDARALAYLRLERDVARIKAERLTLLSAISEKRSQTATLLNALQTRPESGRTRIRALQGDEGARVRRLEKALGAAKGKREMVRGVLRGLVLESGLDWLADEALREALLGMGDEGESEEEGEGDEGELSDEGHD